MTDAGPLAKAMPAVTDQELLQALLVPAAEALPVPPATDRAVWAPGALDQPTLADLQLRAAAELGTPWPQLPLRSYARYLRDGDRSEYEAILFARQRRLSRAAVLAAVTLAEPWLDEVADGVLLLCEQSSWCWPAHDDTPRLQGLVTPDVAEPYLDLGAGEVAAQLAWIDHLLGAALDARVPGLRRRIRHETRVRVFDPFVRRRDWPWIGRPGDAHNWNPWIHGNLLVAALRLVDAPAQRAALVALVADGLDRYLATLPPDGSIDEGYDYWWDGAGRAIEALDLLRHATGGALDPADLPVLRAGVAFPHRMQLGGPWHLNLADCSARLLAERPWPALHRAARRAGDGDAVRYAGAHRTPGAPLATEGPGLGRLLQALTDRDWAGAEPGPPPLPRDVWLPGTQVLLARPEGGRTGGLTLAVKGGHNGEHHNHNDVGSFVVAVAGVPVVVDAGRPTYTAATFGPDRYGIWTMHSDWHNVPRIRGTAQGGGRAFAARAVAVEIADERTGLRLDLAAAYPRSDVRHWWRTAALDREQGRVTITDRWELDPARGASGPTILHLLLAGRVDLFGEGAARVTALQGGGDVTLTWSIASGRTVPAPAVLDVRPLDDPYLSDVWGERLTRLAIRVPDSPTGSLRLTTEACR